VEDSLTPEQIEQARKLIINGATYVEVAQHFSVTHELIFTYFSAMGTHKQMRRERNNRIYEMVKIGKSTQEIASQMGMSLSATERIVRNQRRYAPYL